jgi:Arc/MetJ family transcription regulator
MTKRLIDLDDALLAAAQLELRTVTISETVREALRQCTASVARARQVEWLTEGGLAAVASPEARAEVWR